MTHSPSIGIFAPLDLLERGVVAARAYLDRVAEAGIDHVCCGDHVSFGDIGFDGLVQSTALAMLHPTLRVICGVYLLPLRHPVLVARQLADLSGSRPAGSPSGWASAGRTATRWRSAVWTPRREAAAWTSA